MNPDTLKFIEASIKTIPDYPKPGILFRDITSLIENAEAFKATIDLLAEHYRDQGITKIVGTGGLASPYSASERDVNNHIQVDAGSTIILPDFNLSGYGSALDGSSGAEIYFWPKGAGSYTFQIEAGSTGKVIGQGGLAMAAVATSMVYSPSTANARMPIVARWVDGALWHIEPYRGLGRDQKVFSVAVNPASMAAGTYLNITGIAAAGAKVGDKMSIVTPLAWSARTLSVVNMPPISTGPNCAKPVIIGNVLSGSGISISPMSAMPAPPIGM